MQASAFVRVLNVMGHSYHVAGNERGEGNGAPPVTLQCDTSRLLPATPLNLRPLLLVQGRDHAQHTP